MRATTASALLSSGSWLTLRTRTTDLAPAIKRSTTEPSAGSRVGIDDGIHHRPELAREIGFRRDALLLEALEHAERSTRPPATLRTLVELARVALAAVDDALQVGELEGEHDALGIDAPVLIALDDAREALLEGCKRLATGDTADRMSDGRATPLNSASSAVLSWPSEFDSIPLSC